MVYLLHVHWGAAIPAQSRFRTKSLSLYRPSTYPWLFRRFTERYKNAIRQRSLGIYSVAWYIKVLKLILGPFL